ncbi:MAG: hypothetical protein K2K56_08145 [Lachnospiraceae bacterium]|nr:hypothetical protein [Lachnospiraceae bacterium]
MNKIDKRIMELAKQTKCPVNEGYEERMDQLLSTLEKEEIMTQRKESAAFFTKAGYVVGIIAAILVLYIPTSAAIDYVQKRMSEISENDREMYEELVSNAVPGTEAITYSRELSEEEKEQYKTLWKKYEESGLFPTGEIEIVDTAGEHDGSSLLYEIPTRIIYLPERTLTEEEWLQIIDFYHKEDYSLQQSDSAKQAREEQEKAENASPGEDMISEDMAVNIASDYMERMFAADPEAMEKETDYSEDYVIEGSGTYQIVFYENDTTSYVVDINAQDGTLGNMWLQKEGTDFYEKPAPINKEFFIENYKRAKELFINIFGSDLEIAGITCEYKEDEEGNVPHGNVLYYVEMPDGAAYRFQYNVEQDIFWMVLHYSNYRTEKQLEEEGIRERERVVIPIE